jgi:hypothetical protein
MLLDMKEMDADKTWLTLAAATARALETNVHHRAGKREHDDSEDGQKDNQRDILAAMVARYFLNGPD